MTGFEEYSKIENSTLSVVSEKILTSSSINSFSPLVVTKEKTMKDMFVYDTSLGYKRAFVSIRYPSTSSATPVAVSQSSLASLSTLLSENNMVFASAFSVSFSGLAQASFYHPNKELQDYKLYVYKDGTYTPLQADLISIDADTNMPINHSGDIDGEDFTFVLIKKATPVLSYDGLYQGPLNESCVYEGYGTLAYTGTINVAVTGKRVLGAGMYNDGSSAAVLGYRVDNKVYLDQDNSLAATINNTTMIGSAVTNGVEDGVPFTCTTTFSAEKE